MLDLINGMQNPRITKPSDEQTGFRALIRNANAVVSPENSADDCSQLYSENDMNFDENYFDHFG